MKKKRPSVQSDLGDVAYLIRRSAVSGSERKLIVNEILVDSAPPEHLRYSQAQEFKNIAFLKLLYGAAGRLFLTANFISIYQTGCGSTYVSDFILAIATFSEICNLKRYAGSRIQHIQTENRNHKAIFTDCTP